MAFGGFDREGSRPMAEINMIPLIDVMLVLLVIFIITAPLLTHAVKIDLPKAASAPNLTKPDNIQLAVNAAGQIFWNGEVVEPQRAERSASPQAGRLTPQPEVHIRADQTAQYRWVAETLADAAKAGLTRIGFVSDPNDRHCYKEAAAAGPSHLTAACSRRHRAVGVMRLVAALALVWAGAVGLAHAQVGHTAQTILHMLDYVAVDYPEAVADGRVRNEDEYKEMLEFTAQVAERRRGAARRIAARVALRRRMPKPLRRSCAQSARRREVAAAASKLQAGRWSRPTGSRSRRARRPTSLDRAPALYARALRRLPRRAGRGDGPAAKGLEPAPSDFHDAERMAQRSVYGLYNTITLGVAGTSMAAFERLDEAERWALAFHVATLGAPQERLREGGALWKAGEARGAFPDLTNVATLSANEVGERFGERAAAVQAWLRANPEALAAVKPAPLAFTRAKLAEARAHYAQGDRAAARDAAIRGYLEGFELVEASLANVDAGLAREIERRMLDLRAAIERGEPPGAVADQVARDRRRSSPPPSGRWVPATCRLRPPSRARSSSCCAKGSRRSSSWRRSSPSSAKTGRRDALPYVHAGLDRGARARGGHLGRGDLVHRDLGREPRADRRRHRARRRRDAALRRLAGCTASRTRQAWARFIRDQRGAGARQAHAVGDGRGVVLRGVPRDVRDRCCSTRRSGSRPASPGAAPCSAASWRRPRSRSR